MPAFQSVCESELSQKYRLKAIGCERQAKQATDRATEQQWLELAAQWHSMADLAGRMPTGASRHGLY
jgi:hypothetical protein